MFGPGRVKFCTIVCGCHGGLTDADVDVEVATPSGSPPVIDERSVDPGEVGEETAEHIIEVHETDERLNDPTRPVSGHAVTV